MLLQIPCWTTGLGYNVIKKSHTSSPLPIERLICASTGFPAASEKIASIKPCEQ